MTAQLEILLICDNRNDGAAAVREHIAAFSQFSHHHVRTLNVCGMLPKNLDLNRFDGLILHYSIMADPLRLLPPIMRRTIASYRGLKAVFVQDEHRNVRQRIDLLNEIGAGLLFSCVPESEIEKIYPRTSLSGTQVVSVLTGYAAEGLAALPVPEYAERSTDVGYRARETPPWLGTLAREKQLIGERFSRDATDFGLTCDISSSEYERLYGQAWVDFLMRCKATLGTESGASVFDRDGSIEAKVEAHLARDPSASYDELKSAYFAAHDGAVDNGQVSPRIFEAAALRTLMILYPGRYSGVVQPWRHYVPLAKDHSNMPEVVDVLRSPGKAQDIIENAYREVALNPAYSSQRHVERVDASLAAATTGFKRAQAYRADEWESHSREPARSRIQRIIRTMRDRSTGAIFRGIARVTSPANATALKNRLRAFRHRLRGTIPSNSDGKSARRI